METGKQQVTNRRHKIVAGAQNRPFQKEMSATDKAKMDLDMKTVQDVDDEDCTPWQRQLRVNAFMVQVGVRKMISEGLEHVYEAQEEIQNDIKHKLNFNIEKLEARLINVEKSMFGDTGDPQDAFSKLRHQMYELETARQQDSAQLRKELQIIETKFGGIEFIQETINKQIEKMQEQHLLTEKSVDSKLKTVRDFMDTQANSFKIFMDTSNKNEKKLKMEFNDLVQYVKNDSESLKLTVDQFKKSQALSEQHSLKIMQLEGSFENLRLSKADRVVFEQNLVELRHKMLQQNQSLEETKNKLETCANYLEKYMPIYIQRQFSQCLEFVLPDRSSRWRLKWFEEIKIPLLTQLLFIDVKGKANLEDRVKSLHRLITENIIPSLPNETEVMTEEEAIMAISLKNNMLHSRGKLLIMGLLGQIDPKSQIATEQSVAQDGKKPKLESAEQVFKHLLDQLSTYDPTFKHRINESEEDVQKTMLQALEEDLGTEAVMERAINAAVAKAAYVLDDQMQKIKSDLMISIKEGQIKSHQDLEQEATKTQNYINNVHQFQIEEMQSFKDCHLMYLKAAQKLERKFEVIGDMELQYQTVMKQVKTINQLIKTLSSYQIATIEANQEGPNSGGNTDQPKDNSPFQIAQDSSAAKKRTQVISSETPLVTSNGEPITKTLQSEESMNMHSTLREPGKIKSYRMSTVNQTKKNSKPESSINSQEEAFKSLVVRPKSQAIHHRQKITRNNIVLNITQGPSSGLQLKPMETKSGRGTALANNNTIPTRKSSIIGGNEDLKSAGINSGSRPQSRHGSPDRYAPGSEQHVHKSIVDLNYVNRIATKNVEQMERLFQENVQIHKKAQEQLNKKARKDLEKVHRFGKTQVFKQQLQEFQQRVNDKKCIDEFLSQTYAVTEFRPKTQNYPNRDAIVNKMSFGGAKTSLQIGVKRDVKDAQGVNYVQTPYWYESTSKDGTVQKINQAAGAEMQRGREHYKQVFDQAAVFQSIKNVF